MQQATASTITATSAGPIPRTSGLGVEASAAVVIPTSAERSVTRLLGRQTSGRAGIASDAILNANWLESTVQRDESTPINRTR